MKTSKKRKSTGKTIKRVRKVLDIDYKEDFLMKELQDLDRAAEYLTAAIEGGEDVFLLAVRDVVEAQGGISNLADATKLNRENLYNMLSEKGNPRLSSITSILDKLGFEVRFAPKLQGSRVA